MDHLDGLVERNESVRRLSLSSGDWNGAGKEGRSTLDRLEEKAKGNSPAELGLG